jgi:hypothetical protein
MGCTSFAWWAVADTAFIPICSDPCEIVILDDFGNACMCSVGFPTGVPESPKQTGVILSRSAGEIIIESPAPLSNAICRIYGATGQLIIERGLPSGSKWELPIPSAAQILIVQIISNGRALVARI